ncbi:hypothetical protein [Sphingorhabdus sp. Alg239-R122]|uniref:phage fiber-tail adaptor protein n=1 Tax=Sphingorhabdus sp. Alg239-R122 TaxID=2305989 RepID=UPI0013DCF61E|nr:hypothetical protein [Sphingorhabdus sp. Alg239-R122]
MSLYLKDPGARLDYAMDWSAGYLDGQVITASDWHVVPAEEGGLALFESSHDLTRAATTLCEGFLGEALMQRACTAILPVGSTWQKLPLTPVQVIDGVEGLPAEGAAFPLAPHRDGSR